MPWKLVNQTGALLKKRTASRNPIPLIWTAIDIARNQVDDLEFASQNVISPLGLIETREKVAMAGETKTPEIAKDSLKAEHTRRGVLKTIVKTSVSGMLVKGATAADLRVTDVQGNFKSLVNAYNQMLQIPQPQSPLWHLLDSSVRVYTVIGHRLFASGRNVAIPKMYIKLAGTTFDPFDPMWGMVHYDPNQVTGFARWIDNDRTVPDRIHFTFKFNNSLLFTELAAL
jgi:hypothetical protein